MHQCHFIQSHIHKVHVCLSVTCHLHFRQTDQDVFSHATAVTWERKRHQNKSQHRKLTGEENYPPLLPGLEPATFCSQVQHCTPEPSLWDFDWHERLLCVCCCFCVFLICCLILFVFVSVMMTNSNNLHFFISLYSFRTYWEFQPPAILWLYDGRKSPLSGAILQTFHGQHHFWRNWSSGNRAVAMMQNGHLPCFTWWHAWDSLVDDRTGKKRQWNVWALTKSR